MVLVFDLSCTPNPRQRACLHLTVSLHTYLAPRPPSHPAASLQC
jgi:hypothetical protein